MTDLRVHAVTAVADPATADALIGSSQRHEVPFMNLAGVGGETVTARHVDLVRAFLADLGEDDIVLFVAADETVMLASLLDIGERFLDFDVDVVIAADRHEEGNQASAHAQPNGRGYIGFAPSLKLLLEASIDTGDADDTKAWCARVEHTTAAVNVSLDTDGAIFQTMTGATADVEVADGRLRNVRTDSRPAVLLGGGDAVERRTFRALCSALGFRPSPIRFHAPNGAFDVVGPEILATDFLSTADCARLVEIAENHGGWKSMAGDKFPAQELRLRDLDVDLFNDLEAHFAEHLNPIIEKFWWPMRMHGLRDAFLSKYSPVTQARLASHTDASLVSGLVKLNAGYEGGDTWFHRQQFSTKYVPVGKMMLWPGQVTHGHEALAVTAGTKYSLVIWTSRRQGDVNY